MFQMFQLPFMVQAFFISLVTGVFLAYLGVHVVGRGIVFVVLALTQIIFFRKFFVLTESFENGEFHKAGLLNIWNFLFYLTIGLAIVFAVKIDGVIPVFSYLIIPSVSAIMLARKNLS